MSGGEVPIPVIQGKLYRPRAGVGPAVSEAEVPKKRFVGEAGEDSAKPGCLSSAAVVLGLFIAALWVLLAIASP